ncbi:hypothetical protein MSP8886_01352 [Marinomonas spartinae]|uniref:Uncharacterized protein n=1 Tax=Marinomonas spartinae TaxID=1792290 RepID=A0A1A8TAW8_9GAMM|nr:hypothetical protein [Marinomonas spartinae]SBS28899.1 hypothetical protein MSP8886_01352 [Marinomonas spartinae]
MNMYNPLYSGEFIRDVYLEPGHHLAVLFCIQWLIKQASSVVGCALVCSGENALQSFLYGRLTNLLNVLFYK